MDNSMKNSRRNFIKLAGAATVAAGTSKTFVLDSAYAQEAQGGAAGVSPNDKIQIGLIGAGGQGMGDTETALRVAGVELVAVADVYDGRLTRSKELAAKGESTKGDLFTTRDYREVLARPDVDAVIIATPDHWHAKIGVDALAAGKHIYLEKPMVQEVKEGASLIEAQKKSGRVVQIGSQRVSSIIYRKAKELIASGAIGQLNMVEAVYNRNSALGAWQYSIPPDASPATIDWDRFLGDAPKRPFDPVRLFRWRNYRDYGTGVAGDLFIHLFSGIHYVLGSNGPTRVMSTGGLRYWKDGRDVPDVMFGLYDYPQTATHPAFNLTLQVNFADGSGGEESFRFIGNDGVLTIGGNGVQVVRAPKQKEPGYNIDTFPEAVQKEFLKEYRKKYPVSAPEMSARGTDNYVAPSGYRDSLDHFKNFFASIRSNQPMVEDATFGLRAAGPALLTNESYFNNRVYEWDPEAMKIVKNKT
ncbi:MAG: Gfo/Idh/MocA family oxidoreductase [Acidobacteriota bacterium]|nr:Gfo/Idh/MocA family oxidoreductase [Acidobacteriota bacterium]